MGCRKAQNRLKESTLQAVDPVGDPATGVPRRLPSQTSHEIRIMAEVKMALDGIPTPEEIRTAASEKPKTRERDLAEILGIS